MFPIIIYVMEYNYYGLYFCCKWENNIIPCVVTVVVMHLLGLMICSWGFFPTRISVLLGMLISWMFPICCHNFIFHNSMEKIFLYVHRTNSPLYDSVANPFHRLSFITDLSSKITQVAVYSFFKKLFPEMQTFLTKSLCVCCATSRTTLCNHFRYYMFNHHVFSLELLFSKVYSLASFKNLNFRIFSGRKGKGRFCLPNH